MKKTLLFPGAVLAVFMIGVGFSAVNRAEAATASITGTTVGTQAATGTTTGTTGTQTAGAGTQMTTQGQTTATVPPNAVTPTLIYNDLYPGVNDPTDVVHLQHFLIISGYLLSSLPYNSG
ncbi:MAG: hypothetical protein ACREGC_03790, partial [Minisyncoccia bacterium]